LNILHIGKYFSPFHGGVENYMGDLMGAMVERGIFSTALVHRHDWSLTSRYDSVRLGANTFQIVRAATWVNLFFTPISPAFPWHLARMIKNSGPDVLHLHLPNPSAFWVLALPSARRTPWVVHWHADVVTQQQGWLMKLMHKLYRPLERALLKRARSIIATSAPYRDSSEPLRPFLAKCRVVPLGMDVRRLAPVSLPTEAGEQHWQALRVLAVGRLTYYKGLSYLIDAIARVEHARLDLVGVGDLEQELKRQVASLGLGNRVTFHGATTEQELAILMAQCDCLCLPSIERTEAFGVVLLEAMRFGKPTVVTDVAGSGMGWVVDHGVTGLKVEPGNADALALALQQLGADRGAARRMGERGREKFDRMFEISRTVDDILDTYRAALSNPDEPSANVAS